MIPRLKKAIVVDWETSGIRDETSSYVNYVEGPQGIEIGAVVVDLATWDVLDTFSSSVHFVGSHSGTSYGGFPNLTWSNKAELIHGITLKDLDSAPTASEVAADFASFIMKNFPREKVLFCGHNPGGDKYATNQLFFLGGREIRELKFHYRMLDSFTAGFLLLGTENSNELFSLTSGKERTLHSALEDALLTASAMKFIVEHIRDLRWKVEQARC